MKSAAPLLVGQRTSRLVHPPPSPAAQKDTPPRSCGGVNGSPHATSSSCKRNLTSGSAPKRFTRVVPTDDTGVLEQLAEWIKPQPRTTSGLFAGERVLSMVLRSHRLFDHSVEVVSKPLNTEPMACTWVPSAKSMHCLVSSCLTVPQQLTQVDTGRSGKKRRPRCIPLLSDCECTNSTRVALEGVDGRSCAFHTCPPRAAIGFSRSPAHVLRPCQST